MLEIFVPSDLQLNTIFNCSFLVITQGVGVGAPLIWASTVAKKYTTTQMQCGIVERKT
jgi:hypothetical protein